MHRAGPPNGDPALVELRANYAAYTTSRFGFRVVRRVALSGESWRTETEISLSRAGASVAELLSTGTSTPSISSANDSVLLTSPSTSDRRAPSASQIAAR